jgi:hypothetical protein
MDTTAGASRRFTDVMCGSCPGGTIENSPAFQGWVKTQRGPSPERTAEILNSSFGDPTVVTARQEPRPTGSPESFRGSRDHFSVCIRPGATACAAVFPPLTTRRQISNVSAHMQPRHSRKTHPFTPVARTFLSAGSGDFPVPSSSLETVLESTVNPQARKSALLAATMPNSCRKNAVSRD